MYLLHALRFRYTPLTELYLSMGLKAFGLSLFSIFVPIYLYQIGYAPSLIFAYLFFEQVFKFLTTISAVKFVARYGAKHAIASGFACVILNLSIMYLLPTYPGLLFLFPITAAIATNLYWIGYHTHISHTTTQGKRGRDLSILTFVVSTLNAVGPLVGGLLATQIGMQSVFILSLMVIGLAIVPLLRSKDPLMKRPINVHKLQFRPLWRDMAGIAGFGIDQQTTLLVWPFFIFLLFGSYTEVGLITTLSYLLGIVTLYLVGTYADRGYRRLFIRLGAVFNACSYLLRIGLNGFAPVLFISATSDAMRNVVHVPWHAVIYEKADRWGRLEYLLLMEWSLNLARAMAWAALFFLSLVLPLLAAVQAMFVLAAGATLLMTLVRVRR